MGGRGAKGSGKHGKISKTIYPAGQGGFFDKTRDFAGMSLHEFENAIRGKSVEYVGGFDSNGDLVFVGTSQNERSVTIPKDQPGLEKVTTLTHNHPLRNDHQLGGTFSPADVMPFINLPQIDSIRVVASGKGEHTYIMRKSAGANSDPEGLWREGIAMRSGGKFQSMGDAAVNKMINNVKRPLTKSEYYRAFTGGVKNAWTEAAAKYGFEYVVIKKAPW